MLSFLSGQRKKGENVKQLPSVKFLGIYHFINYEKFYYHLSQLKFHI